jgi:hypothetical protein
MLPVEPGGFLTEPNRNLRLQKEHTMKSETHLNTMMLCVRYGVSVKSFDHWKLREGFPRDASAYAPDGQQVWCVAKIDAWLRQRPIKTGPRPRWLVIVGHPAAMGRDASGNTAAEARC